MPSFELRPSGHLSTHSPPFNEYPSIHDEHIPAILFYWIFFYFTFIEGSRITLKNKKKRKKKKEYEKCKPNKH